jgi:hypothetical protein
MHTRFVYFAGLLALVACSGGEGQDGDDPDGGGNGGENNGANGTGNNGAGNNGTGNNGSGNNGETGNTNGEIDPCDLQSCGLGQRCEVAGDEAQCIDNTCDDLTCSDTEECVPAPGGGFYCKSNLCSSDLECGTDRYCDGQKCVDDVCTAGAARCEGNQVIQCTSNGGEEKPTLMCADGGYFDSICGESAGGTVGCSCQDDWDCPSFTECNGGLCQGTGVAPTCTLPALPFTQVLPSLEFRWGGESSTSKNATGRIFPAYAQVVSTPIVANLNDDNGDGFINEFDFPELVFSAYTSDVHQNGIVRAVHGGGPERGKDYFALCGKTKRWFEGDPVTGAGALTCASADGLTRPGDGLAVGDLDGNGVPEIVVATEAGKLQILSNRGELISESAELFLRSGSEWRYPQVSLANLDNQGLVEVIVGNRVQTLQKTQVAGVDVISVLDWFEGTGSQGAQDDSSREFGPTSCPANLIDADANDDDATQEIVVGTSLYRLPTPPAGVTKVVDCMAGDTSDFCTRKLTEIWNAQTVSANTGATAVPNLQAFCAVADVLGQNKTAAPGPGNAPDGAPEIVLVSNGRVLILEGATGILLRKIDVEVGQRGGAPNVDDFDGDGFPEVAMASSGFYTVIDLQETSASCPAWPTFMDNVAAPGTNPARDPGPNPNDACTSNTDCNSGAVCNTTIGQCVCLHNGWKRKTEDDSSRVTSSSVFDFNGDGAAEVVYGDECYFRIYDGASSNVHLAVPSVSRTILENPVVADVDNDGNAEIVFVNNNETFQCKDGADVPRVLTNPDGTTISAADLPNGIQVWGDAKDTWVSARRIWNQHAYHVTNVTESGHIPVREPESWKPYGNRLYNTYRSQPRAFGVAPDLALLAMQVSSPDVACGQLSDELQIVALVKNLGDLRVGPGVDVSFYGAWAGATSALQVAGGGPLTATLQTSLEPGASVLVSVLFNAQNNPQLTLPEKVIARIDEAMSERECKEDNNSIEKEVSAGEQSADLRLEIGAATGSCSATKVAVTVHNDGSASASDVLVRLYAGDPSSGGAVIGETTLPGPIAPGEAATGEVILQALDRIVTLYGIADPEDAIVECNNANNLDEGPEVICGTVVL